MLNALQAARVPGDYSGKLVSTASVWDDDVWHLDIARVVVHDRTIRWSIKLADGVLTDHRHRQLLLTSKALIYEMMFGDYGHYRRVKPSSAVQFAHNLSRLLRWMSAKRIYRFTDLTPQHLVTYRNLVRNSRNAGAATSPIARKTLSAVTQSNLLAPLRALIMLADRIPDHPSGDRRSLLDILKIQRPLRTHGKTKRIPDDIAVPLFESARRWVDDYGPTLIAQYQAADEGFRNSPAEHPDHRSTHAHKARRSFAAQGADLAIAFRDATLQIGSIDGLTFRSLIQHLETACFIAIAGFVGMRISEIGSLKRDALVTKHLQDGRAILLLKATLYKTVRDAEGQSLDWVAGWDDGNNPVRHAVEMLIRLRKIDTAHSDFLFVGLKHRNTRTHVPLIAADYRRRINDFARFVGIDCWRFAPHQFRKTFARFVTKRDFTGLLALQRHFAHVSLQMTELYGSWDDELIADVLDEELEQDYEALDTILASDCLAGQKGQKEYCNATIGSAGLQDGMLATNT